MILCRMQIGIQTYGIDEPYHEEEKMAPPVVRQVAPPSTSSEELEFRGSHPSRSSREEKPPQDSS
jgi:hypothetical protein